MATKIKVGDYVTILAWDGNPVQVFDGLGYSEVRGEVIAENQAPGYVTVRWLGPWGDDRRHVDRLTRVCDLETGK